MSSSGEIISNTVEFVKKELSGVDGSHDWQHIDRVRKLAVELGKKEGNCNLEIVELAALLHDIKDWKYSGSETAGVDAAKNFLITEGYNDQDKLSAILFIIENIGFKTELGQRESGAKSPVDRYPEFGVVQDADRLDAIGAIGIARTFTFGGAKNRAIYDPAIPYVEGLTKKQYMELKAPTVNHFYEKLLLLKDMMKTKSGKECAEGRHQFMSVFLKQFFLEVEGKL